MNATQALIKVRGAALVLGAVWLCGCAVSTGSGLGQTSLAAPASTSFTVCDGSHASRLPGREEVGRVCRPATSLKLIL